MAESLAGKICKFDHELGKCIWIDKDDSLPESKAPFIEGVKEIRAVGLPGQPMFHSRKSYEKAVRDAGYVVVGNEKAAMAPSHRREQSGLTRPGEAERRNRK